jgi:hypothetical protein
MSMTVAPGANADAKPPSPNTTSRTAVSSGSMVMAASALRAASAKLVAARPP